MMEPSKKVLTTAVDGVLLGVSICACLVGLMNSSITISIIFLLIAIFSLSKIINTVYKFEAYQTNILSLIESLVGKITNYNQMKTDVVLSALAATISTTELKMEEAVKQVLGKVLSEE